MKKTKPTIVLFAALIALLSNTIFAQNIHGQATYHYKTTIDINKMRSRQLSEQQKKIIANRMKHVLEKTYVLNFNQSESVYIEENSNQQEGFEMMTDGSSFKKMYKNIEESKLLVEQKFFGETFLIDDSLTEIEWKTGEETKQIGEHTCNKATIVNHVVQEDGTSVATTITAWYAKEIPVSQGPSEYWGLPGLILEVSTDKISILCSKLTLNPSEGTEIIKPIDGKKVTKDQYAEIVKKKLTEIRKL
ncbi:GLPGLI family protein [Mangrovimonas cancribranchiae]|uniref:GLPGLI family protein n=1 Tax=Mangrovimonas cancribranchiae TaxID=3080055 RepID=A0AAU6NY75_9FLAO